MLYDWLMGRARTPKIWWGQNFRCTHLFTLWW